MSKSQNGFRLKFKPSIETFMLTHVGNLIMSPLVPANVLRHFMITAERHKRPFIASINVVNRCNLNCAGCYWQKWEAKQNRNELTPEAGDSLIYQLWSRGVRQFLLIGGEPMEEREKLEHWVRTIASLKGISTVITNGTYGLPKPQEWPRTHYMISCDGDKPGMDKIRGQGVWEKVKDTARSRTDVSVAMTISLLNVSRIDAFVREVATWGVCGVAFSFATPNVGDRQRFYLSEERKELAVQQMLQLKEEFGDFIIMSRRAIELLRPSEVQRWSPHCPTFAAVSHRADGIPIERCIFGPQGDCSRCGCNISTSFAALREGDKETARFVTLPAIRAGIR